MKGFIEVTDIQNTKFLIPVNGIRYVAQYDDGTACIELTKTHFKKRTVSSYLHTVENYDEVLAKIEKATE